MTANERLMLMIGQLFAQIAQLQTELEASRVELEKAKGADDAEV